MGIFKTVMDLIKGDVENDQSCCGKLHYNSDISRMAKHAKEQGCTIKVTGTNENACRLYDNVVEAMKLSKKEYVDIEWIKDGARISEMSLEPGIPNLVLCGKVAAFGQVLSVEQLTEMFERILPEKEEDGGEEVIELNTDKE